ncbi:unnamed protein product [Phaedon cochleariae]|uniref:CYTH domain-containing protein n=1 Tax=Phaedon cochleariae TaxID=80249 RepID=A0A9P0DSZ3_PHACE|nr:unnamed protein product [Phaedon cochleariae]
MRNIEIKAKVRDLTKLMDKVRSLEPQKCEIIKQEDTFFNTSNGRLKLRKFENGTGELIFYNRPDTEGPKMCSYEKSDVSTENFNSLHSVLERSLGAKTTVKKTRQLFIVDQTRVHVDSVDKLGNFMELEVVLNDNQTPEDGEQIAFNLMTKLGVEKEDLISGAYADLLNKI